MGFFDFLSAPAQDPTLEDQELFGKKKISPDESLKAAQLKNKEIQEEQSKTVEGAANANKSARMAQQGLIQDYDRAVGDAYAAIQNTTGSFGKQGSAYSRPSRETLLSVQQIKQAIQKKAPPVALADDFSRLSQNKEFSAQERKAFEGVAAMFQRAARSMDAAAVSGERVPTVPTPESVDQAKAKIDALRRQEEAARQKLETLGVTNPQRAGTQNAIAEIAKEREHLEGLLQSVTPKGQAGGKGTFAQENSDPNLPPTNPKPVESEFNALGVKRKQLAQSVADALEAAGIEEGEWDMQVPTQAGLKRVLSVLDKDGSFAQKLAADIIAEKQRNQPQQADEFQDEVKKVEGSADRISAQLSQQRSELRELYKSLNSQPFMQSWLGLTLYVLLGMLAGPTNAAKLLGVGRNRNAILGEIESLKEEMRFNSQEMRRQEDRAFQLRKEAITRLQRDRDYTRSRDDSLAKMYINHKLILERAKQTAAPGNRAIVSKLEGDFNRTLKLMSDAEKIMNNDWLDDNDPKKVKASREYARMRDEAEFIDQKLRALTEQLSPGTYSSEEEEASAP